MQRWGLTSDLCFSEGLSFPLSFFLSYANLLLLPLSLVQDLQLNNLGPSRLLRVIILGENTETDPFTSNCRRLAAQETKIF